MWFPIIVNYTTCLVNTEYQYPVLINVFGVLELMPYEFDVMELNCMSLISILTIIKLLPQSLLFS